MGLRRILLLQSDSALLTELRIILRFLDCEVIACDLDTLRDETEPEFDAIFVGVDDDIEKVVLRIVELYRQAPLVLVMDKSPTRPLPAGLENRASAVLAWPTNHAALSACLEKISRGAPEVVNVRPSELFRSLTGASAAVQRTRKLIQQVAPSDATVLILGESGTGKEVIARNLHYYSARRSKPFVPVNCGAIPGELLESELFGHEKGAFTGALSSRQGRFEMAEGGTLFLDEIGDMPLSMQVKLLRVLQERCFERVGSNRTIQCDVRIIAATHRNLEEEIGRNRFREDLYYRLNVFPIDVPSLRERLEDVPTLVEDLTARLKAEKRGDMRLTPAALRVLQRYHWPGNVRELANLIERLAILFPNGVVDAADLPEKFQQYVKPEDATLRREPNAESVSATDGLVLARLPGEGLDLREHLNNLECELIKQALDECNGVVAHAANLLKMRRTTLVEKLRKYGLRGEETTVI
ncbi:sigma-54 dependent transcriptional regulator [Methylocaldum sp. 14B]|jgi:sigma-54 specific flagellar transcriptional regulator A|uniref:sigma-54 dependent transcriptional regulator n=1 Tax=Methylocaldum sp. 14B TaxID=1912213 RepID=UPI00098A5F4F|nr:sigma-54 dependent transcriptional regulator [Methylocaldum sp. 14B]